MPIAKNLKQIQRILKNGPKDFAQAAAFAIAIAAPSSIHLLGFYEDAKSSCEG